MSNPILKITFELYGSSMAQLSDAICQWDKKQNGTNIQGHIIDIEELYLHLKAYVEAERKYEAVMGELNKRS